MGLTTKPDETWDECEVRVQELIEVNLDITDAIEFERCHRISEQTNFFKNQNHPRTIICIATNSKDKPKKIVLVKDMSKR